ncbi:T9SS type A sorting domain-containing protein [candidate division GN15 bacterium]|nr:T9SS type A sorting domain-containing protein [candidate division GN15 bacterium]
MTRWIMLMALLVVGAAPSLTANCVTIHWTATGDDGLDGTATYYDIRYSRTPITEQNFYQAQQVIFPPTPKESGSAEQFTICALEAITGYYFAIKAADEVGNWSPISNVPFIVSEGNLGFRGDVNMNGIHYEVGDVLIFTNYFIYGSSVFTVNTQEQVASTDVNADNLTLTVADLTYLIRVVTGDASPILNRLNPYAQQVSVSTEQRDGRVTVATDAISSIGTAHFVYRVDSDLSLGDLRLRPAARDMDLTWHREGDELRILLYDLGHNRIPAGQQELFDMSIDGSGSLELQYAEVADYDGRPYESSYRAGELPSTPSLEQNYPNPFNPSTTIQYALPAASDVTIEVLNLLGQRVRLLVDEYRGPGVHRLVWDGRDESGDRVASGVYFYRIATGDFVDSRKMLLLK